MGYKSRWGKLQVDPNDFFTLKELAKTGLAARIKVADLERKLDKATKEACLWKQKYEHLLEQTKDFLAALK